MRELILSLCALFFIRSAANILLEDCSLSDITDLLISAIVCLQILDFIKNILE